MKRILIINSSYYKQISKKLVLGAKKMLSNKKFNISIFDVPGIYEIPIAIRKNINKFDGFIALGCVIKRQTPQFDFISYASTDAIMNLSINSKKPIGNGILTCLNMKQAKARKNKGAEAANAILSVLSQK